MKIRCAWVGKDPIYQNYHDHEWGVPVYDDRILFEFLVLEGAQAGLSWLTILKRRAAYRAAFADFDPVKVAAYTEREVEGLLQNEGIIRNRLKIASAISNAREFLRIQKEYDSFSAYQWQFVGGAPRQNQWHVGTEVPAVTKEAEVFSEDLRKRGFRFVGPTIIYAHMQAVGMVNDHTTDCFRYKELQVITKK